MIARNLAQPRCELRAGESISKSFPSLFERRENSPIQYRFQIKICLEKDVILKIQIKGNNDSEIQRVNWISAWTRQPARRRSALVFPDWLELDQSRLLIQAGHLNSTRVESWRDESRF